MFHSMIEESPILHLLKHSITAHNENVTMQNQNITFTVKKKLQTTSVGILKKKCKDFNFLCSNMF